MATKALTPHRVAVLLYPGVQILDVAGPVELMKSVGQVPGEAPKPTHYDVTYLAAAPGEVPSTCGIPLAASTSYQNYRSRIDSLLVPGGEGVMAARKDKALIAAIARLGQRAARVIGICSGSLLLAEAGLLQGCRATSHWAVCEYMARRYPETEVDADAIWVKDGNVYTSAGVTAGMDLTLALITEDHGREVALAIARQKVMYMVRAGGQSQFSTALLAQSAGEGRTARLAAAIADAPEEDWRLPVMADEAGMSERTFSRTFTKEMGMTPAKFVETARLDAARRMLEDTGKSIEAVADATGFGDAERLRRTFHRRLGLGPAAYRNRFAAPMAGRQMELQS